MKVTVNLSGVDGVLQLLRNLPPEVVSKRGGPVKLALKKGAVSVLLPEVLKNLKAAIALHGDESTGLLLANVVATRGKEPIGGKGERYLVRVRSKVYANRKAEAAFGKSKKAKAPTTRKTAALLEYGSAHQPATPWLRPAVHTKGAEVIEVVRADLLRRLDLVVRRLARQARGR